MSEKCTVAWLIEELKKFPQDMEILIGDRDDTYYNCCSVQILRINDGLRVEEDDDDGEDVVCIDAD